MSVIEDYTSALAGNRGFLEDQIGFEAVTRAARLVLVKDLNENIARQAERWLQEDLALQRLGLDPGVGQIEVHPIELANFHEGPHESLMAARPEAFPNVSVMAYVTTPSGEQFDQFDTSDLTLFVETQVIAGPVPQGQETAYETIAHRRIERTTEAVHATIKRSGTLLGAVDPPRLPPRGGIGPATYLKRQDGNEPRSIIHGSRLQYTLQRHARF